jgi:hypothetical protein
MFIFGDCTILLFYVFLTSSSSHVNLKFVLLYQRLQYCYFGFTRLVTIADVYCYGDFLLNELQTCRHPQRCLYNISVVSYSRCFCAKDYTLS